MRKPRLGEVRIVTDLGEGDQIVSVYELTQTLEELQLASELFNRSGVLELSTPSAKIIGVEEREQDCPDCPIQITRINRKQRVIATSRTHTIPAEHIGCAAHQLTYAANTMLTLTTGHEIPKASSNPSQGNT